MGNLFSVKNWLKEIVFPYDYCEALNNLDGSAKKTGQQILKTRKNQVFSLQRNSAKKVHDSVVFSNLKYSFNSPMLYVETVKINSRKESLLDFAVNRYIKKLNLYEDGFQFCYDVLSFNGKSAVVNIYALSSTEASEILKSVPYSSKPVTCLIPLELVLTELLAKTGTNPVISLWAEDQQILILVTKGKEIISRGTYQHRGEEAEFAQWVITNKYIQNAIDLVKRQEGDEEELSFLTWGKSYKLLENILVQHLKLSIDKGLEAKIAEKLNWKAKLADDASALAKQSNVATRKEGNRPVSKFEVFKHAVFSNPALFGLPVCKQTQTFISPNYKFTYSRFKRSRYSLMFSVTIFMIFAAFNLLNYSTQASLEAKNNQSKIAIETGIKQMKKQIPDDKRLASVLDKANLKTAMNTELNVINFLGWITNIAPENSTFDQLLIEAVVDDPIVESKKSRKSLRKVDMSKKYTVEINLKLDRAYSDSVTQIDSFFAKLNERITSPQSKFIYLNASDKIPSALSLTFFVEPSKFF